SREFTQLRLMESERSETFAIACQRQRQAQQHTATLEQRADWSLILLRLIGALDLQAQEPSIRLERVVDRAQQTAWVDGVVDDIKRGHHIVPAGQSFGRVCMADGNPLGQPGSADVFDRTINVGAVDVVADEARLRKGLSQFDQSAPAAAADVRDARAIL